MLSACGQFYNRYGHEVIPYGRHDINDEEILAVARILEGDWLTTGPAVSLFESSISELCGGYQVVAVSSGTAALHCAFVALELRPGDEIISTPLSFIGTVAPALQMGVRVQFADVESDTGNIDPRSVESLVSESTKAIVAVDYAGHPAEVDELKKIAEAHGLALVIDAAHSLGSNYKGRPVGADADITTFSFFPTKNITTGEGGAITGRRANVVHRAREFARQGIVRDKEQFVLEYEGEWHQEVHRLGLNYRLPDILAELGRAQLSRLQKFGNQRRHMKAVYDDALSDHLLAVPAQRAYVEPVWHLYPARVPAAQRARIFAKLREDGIGVQVNYMPIYWHPALREMGYPLGLCPNAERFFSEEISLPIHTTMTSRQQCIVIDSVRRVCS